MTGATSKRGAALITALMITAVMAVVAVGLSQGLFYSIGRSGNLAARDTAYWYAMGARDFAEGALVRSLPPAGEPMRPGDAWVQGARQFEIEGGALVGHVRDMNNCFNLNSLVRREGAGRYIADEAAGERFMALAEALNLPAGEAQAILSQATDWIDSDSQPAGRGAEDITYLQRPLPHRAANTLFTEREELLALPAMTRPVYAVLAPLVCAQPAAEAAPLNPNTLRAEQAPLLAAALGNRLSLSDTALLISRRPSTGFPDLETFWTDPLLAGLDLEVEDRPALTLNSRYFEIRIEVRQGEARYALIETVERVSGNRLERHHQRFGVFL